MKLNKRILTAFLLSILLFLSGSGLLADSGGGSKNGKTSELEQKATRSPSGDEEDGPLAYLIITTSDLSSEMEPLKVWRSKTGTRAEIHVLDGPDGILNRYSGVDQAASLFDHITRVYETTNGSLEYVLLAGDDDRIPIRYLWANASRWDYDDRYLSDVYFSSPGTDWDADGDGRFGERDDLELIGVDNISFPLKVGRFPVSTPEEAGRMTERVIEYESSPATGNWTSRGILSSSLMERPNVLNDPSTPQEDEGFDPYKDNGYKAIFNYTLRYFPGSLELEQYHDYTRWEGGNYSNTTDGLGIDDLFAELNRGSAFFTFAGQSFYDIEYGHSPPIAYSLAQYMDASGVKSGGEAFAPALTYEDCWNLTNNGRLPVAYISSCDSANFSSPGDTSLENMVMAPQGGAICMIGSTGVSWRGEGKDYSLGNWYLLSKFWQKMMGSNRPGDSLYWLKEHYIRTKWQEYATKEVFLIGLYGYNLLGDPALSSWIGPPRSMRVSFPSAEGHYAGGDSLSVRVTDINRNPLANMKVSVYLPGTGEVFSRLTGPDGKVDVPTSFDEGGNGSVTVTGKNFIPNTTNITVLDQPTDLMVHQGSLTMLPEPLTEQSPATLSFDISNAGGRDAETARIMVKTNAVPDNVESWVDPVAEDTATIEKGETTTFSFTLYPARSWESISVGVISRQTESDLSNNIARLELNVNGAPRFLSTDLLEMREDQKGGEQFDLSEMVYDPDNDEISLVYSMGSGAPPWCSLSDHTLQVEPPENWSGSFDLDLRVSDGLASDIRSFTFFVSPVNDPPFLVGLQNNYTAMVDRPFSVSLVYTDVEGDAVSITLNSSLERLNLIGDTLRMVPYSDDIGTHPVNLTLKDSLGGSTKYSFILNIIPSDNALFFTEPSVHLPAATAGETYDHRISVSGNAAKGATFQDDTPLFDIDPDSGRILFEPKGEDVGEHWITITVTSGDHSIERTFILEIREEDQTDTTMYWILGIVAAILLMALVGVIFWSGPRVDEYGLEE